MAHKMLKIYSILFYFLSIVLCFFTGMQIAAWLGTHENQGLAGGAIIFSYGVIGAGIGLVTSFFIAYRADRKFIIRLNLILAALIAIFFIYIYFNHKRKNEMENLKNKNDHYGIINPQNTTTANLFATTEINQNESFGIGMFSPNTFDNSSLLLYGNLNLDKSYLEHSPTDSITFDRHENGGFDIATAPPYLVPEHVKLDYDLLMFKVISVTQDFLEIEVNKNSDKKLNVIKSSGIFYTWSEFFLHVNSVEFINSKSQNVYLKPLENSSKIKENFQFMKPLKVRHKWMYVSLIENHQSVGNGWIKWNENGKMLIKYSLFA